MRQVTRICDRCGAVLTDQPGSIVEVKAGDLTRQFSEALDLCSDCSGLFSDFLKAGHQTHQAALGGILQDTAVASMRLSRANA
jgi:hypothetical protein